MEGVQGSEALRAAAPDWSLAGDRQLLTLLQQIHQKIMAHCEDTNTKLEEMVTALDTASISLQNVNNRFMALSNSQFVESRVYDDDTDVNSNVNENKKPSPAPVAVPSPAAGLLTLERLHEPVPICQDSESDSDSDQPTSVILKPKDPYVSRPLPYVIGSYNWKNKWHVGLMAEESETDSSRGSRVESPAQYSDSDTESEVKAQALGQRYRQSSSSSSERDVSKSVEAHASESAQPTQADIAAELARRLGGYVEVTCRPSSTGCFRKAPTPQRVIDEETPTSAPRKLYKPQQPTSATIFFDEPPPLDATKDSDTDVCSNSDNDDIFAEINRKAPYSAKNKAQNAANVDIFVDLRDDDDDFAKKEPKFGTNKVSNETNDDFFVDDRKEPKTARTGRDFFEDSRKNDTYAVKDRSQNALVNEIRDRVASNKVDNVLKSKKLGDKRDKPLFDETEDTDLFAKVPDGRSSGDIDKNTVKKPAGAISLFGNNKGAASIGAAILNRNRRKSSSDESNDSESISARQSKCNKIFRENTIVKESRDDNVATEASVNKNTGVRKKELSRADVRQKERDIFDDLFEKSAKKEKAANSSDKKDVSKKVDLFSDNIFDDIDDIFSSNVVVKKSDKSKGGKSIFDDDDGLFADIDNSATIDKNFDCKNAVNVKNTNDKGIFDSDDDLFSNEKQASTRETSSRQENAKHKDIAKVADISTKTDNNASIFNSDDGLFTANKEVPKSTTTNEKAETAAKKTNISSKVKESKTLFDDSDSDDIFSNIKPQISSQKSEILSNNTEVENVDINNTGDAIIKVKDSTETKTDKNNEGTPQSSSEETAKSNQENNNYNMQTSTDSVKSYETVNIFLKSRASEEKMVKSSSIFDDDDDDDDETDELFTKSVKKEDNINIKQITESQEKQKSLIRDEKNHPNVDVMKKSNDFRFSSIFDSDNENDLFRKTPEKEKTSESNKTHEKSQESNQTFTDDSYRNKDDEIFKENSTAQKPRYIDNETENLDKNKNIEEKGALFSETENSNSSIKMPSIFDDIYTEPPVFEKPKEPKRSKNINALFDDDSDDESLFFRKTDAIGDDKVDDFFAPNEEKVTLFHDEPPAIDIDFDGSVEKIKENKFEDEKNTKADFKPLSNKHLDNTDGVNLSRTEPVKVIGKLKPMQFNINVNTLLPGASPKKVVKIAPQLESLNDHEKETPKTTIKDVITKPNNEPSTSKVKTEQVISKLVKSASFEETPESPVLDNKVSKDRAKIQVKRRPSTRRARKEAVRKSAIDIVDSPDDGSQDSVDNVNDFEDETDSNDLKVNTADDFSSSSKSNEGEVVEIQGNDFDKEIKQVRSGVKENVDVNFDSSNDAVNIFDKIEGVQKSSAMNVLTSLDHENIFGNESISAPKHTEDSDDLFKQKVFDLAKTATDKAKKHATATKTTDKTQILNINDVDVYIIKDKQVTDEKTESKEPSLESPKESNTRVGGNEEVQYIGRVYKKSDKNIEIIDQKEISPGSDQNVTKEKKLSNKKPSIFDDLSDDDDLFGGSSKSQKSKQKYVFSAKEDDDIFSTRSSVKKDLLGVKTSLFDDDDDEDDEALFGVKRKTSEEVSQQSKKEAANVKPKTKMASTVLEDPLSLFDNDDIEL